MTARRLIGLDLAWSERNGTGCAELVREGGELTLTRIGVRDSIDEIVEWVQPAWGKWVVAVDAPLVVTNQTGRRQADAEASKLYGRFEAGAYPANLKLLGQDHRGGQVLDALKQQGGRCVERPQDMQGGSVVFETYPHPCMIELFRLARTIKYKKKGTIAERQRAQAQLTDAIRINFIERPVGLAVRLNDDLARLLDEPDGPLSGSQLKDREDQLDALVCAYVAAWADAGSPLRALGELGHGVMLLPWLRHLRRP